MNEETEKRCHKFDFVFLALFPQITDLEMRVYGVCVCACVWRPLIDQTREWVGEREGSGLGIRHYNLEANCAQA